MYCETKILAERDLEDLNKCKYFPVHEIGRPFLDNTSKWSANAVWVLINKIPNVIFAEIEKSFLKLKYKISGRPKSLKQSWKRTTELGGGSHFNFKTSYRLNSFKTV